ncbi:MAG: CNNM domain-containing protein [Planctomycetota bacterium]
MSGGEMAFWLTLMMVGFFGSALYSGMETGAYRINRVRLHIRLQRGDKRVRSLDRLLKNPTLLLATLLIGNNLANYMGTASLSVILDGRALPEWQVVLLNTAIVTPVLFVFGEVLPKDLFSRFSDALMPRLAWVLRTSEVVFTAVGLVPVVRGFGAAVLRLTGKKEAVRVTHPRRTFHTLVREGVGYGLISDEQSALADRVLQLAGKTVADEMTPWDEAVTVGLGDPLERVWEMMDRSGRSRLPVVDAEGEVVGVLNTLEVLFAGRGAGGTVGGMMGQVVRLAGGMPLRSGLARMQAEHVGLAVVVGEDGDGTAERAAQNPSASAGFGAEAGNPIGLVTVKDLVEPVTGELTSW